MSEPTGRVMHMDAAQHATDEACPMCLYDVALEGYDLLHNVAQALGSELAEVGLLGQVQEFLADAKPELQAATDTLAAE